MCMYSRFVARVLLGLVLSVGVFAQNVKMASGEWAPYSGEKLAGQGLVTEIITAASKAAGMTPDFDFYGNAWLRCENEVKTGVVFAAFPYSITAERKTMYDFSDPVLSTKARIFYIEGKGKDIAWSTQKDLAAYSFIGIAGYNYVSVFKELNIKMESTSSAELAFKMLLAGRAPYFIEDEMVGNTAAKAALGADANKVRMMSKSWLEEPMYLLVSRTYPNSKEILAKFNAGLQTIKKNGTYKSLLAKYGLSD